LLITTSLICVISILGQSVPKGKYVGLEPMYSGPFALYPGIDYPKETDTTKNWFHSNKWFHEVTIEVLSDSCINISKVPVYFIKGKKFYSDSTGGFYIYQCAEVWTYSEFAPPEIRGKKFISGSITDCQYCRKFPTAIPKYANLKYNVDITKKGDLCLWSDEYERIIYKKKEKELKKF